MLHIWDICKGFTGALIAVAIAAPAAPDESFQTLKAPAFG